MKQNNILKIMAIMVVSMTLVVTSCKDEFLELAPTGSLGEAQLASASGVEKTLIGAYAALNGVFGNRFEGPNHWVTGSITGGEANKGTDPGDYSSINPVQRYETDATQGDLNNLWRGRYEGVSRCNNVLRLAAASTELTDGDKARIMGEARLLRGHFYFDLKKHYNSIPWFDENVVAADIPTIPNSTDVWGNIEADFQYAFDNLPETQGDAGRVNKWAAAAYMGKALLYQGKHGDALGWFNDVMSMGKTTNGLDYDLLDDYSAIYNAEFDNHAEAIMDVESAINSGSTQNANYFDDLNYPYNTGADGPGNCCGFFQPSFELANSFKTDADGLPLLDGSYNDVVLDNDYGIESSDAFTPYAGNLDPRIDHSIGRRGIPYLDWIDHPGKAWIRSQPYAGPYSPKKYIYYRSQEGTLTDGSSWTRGYATMNYTIIRYADVVLMAAECEAEAGSLTNAKDLVNLVRARAAMPEHFVKKSDGSGDDAANYVIGLYDDSHFGNKDDARAAIRMERKLELSGEGHRFFDLVRWGIADATLDAYLDHEAQWLTAKFGGASFTAGKSEYFPIPQTQIDIQGAGVLTQNPGY